MAAEETMQAAKDEAREAAMLRLAEYAEAVTTLSHLVEDSCGLRTKDSLGLAIIMRVLAQALDSTHEELNR